MPEKIHATSDVFGITRELPLNYVTRDSVDNVLIDNLTRNKHLVVFGSSKQGKTSLRKHCLKEDDYIVVHCFNKWSLSDIHSAILKKVGFEITQSNSKTISGKSKIYASIKAGLFGSEVSGGAESVKEKTSQVTTQPLELDPEDVNDVIAALMQISFNKYIVLEDFHYLNTDTQKDFAVALKAFHEESPFCFLIIGVWLEENRLAVYNGDLTGRVVSINADKWEDKELLKVIADGEALLNVGFSDEFKKELLENSFGSVYIVQETCYKCCTKYAVNMTLDELKTIGTSEDADILVEEVVNQQTGRFHSFITQFADGFQSTSLEMHRWLLHPIILAEIADLQNGIRYSAIRKDLVENHPQGSTLNPGNITQALQYTAALQVKKDIKPIVLDYDQTNLRLRVVDSGFLIWLNKQDRNELLDLAGLPQIP